jgi:hypothetical protein
MGALDKIIRQGVSKVRGGRDLPMDPESRMGRATEGGYTRPGVHMGVVHNPDQLREIREWDPNGRYYEQFSRFQPLEHTHRGGSYFAMPNEAGGGTMREAHQAAESGLQKDWWRGGSWGDGERQGTTPSGTSYPVLLRDKIFGLSRMPDNSPLLDIIPQRVVPQGEAGSDRYAAREAFRKVLDKNWRDIEPRDLIRERAEISRERAMQNPNEWHPTKLEAMREAQQGLRRGSQYGGNMLFEMHYKPEDGGFVFSNDPDPLVRRTDEGHWKEPLNWSPAEEGALRRNNNVKGPAARGRRSDVGEFLNWGGYDGMIVSDEAFNRGRTNSSYMWNPSAIRSRFAKFDPANFHRAGLTLGVAAPVAGGALSQVDRRQMEDDGGRR